MYVCIERELVYNDMYWSGLLKKTKLQSSELIDELDWLYQDMTP